MVSHFPSSAIISLVTLRRRRPVYPQVQVLYGGWGAGPLYSSSKNLTPDENVNKSNGFLTLPIFWNYNYNNRNNNHHNHNNNNNQPSD